MLARDNSKIRPRILVADDDRLILLTLVEGLSAAGFDVLSAQDGTSALAICLEQKPVFALLDIRMPGLSGIKLAQRLAQETEVAFMFLTAYDDQSLIDDAISAGAFGYVVKPIEVARIAPMIQAAIARARELRKSRLAEQGLVSALSSNREIATAIGMLMQRHNISNETAFEAMRRHAREHQLKVVDLANAITCGGQEICLDLESNTRFAENESGGTGA
jgi:two-component system, response regulator PdtaR